MHVKIRHNASNRIKCVQLRITNPWRALMSATGSTPDLIRIYSQNYIYKHSKHTHAHTPLADVYIYIFSPTPRSSSCPRLPARWGLDLSLSLSFSLYNMTEKCVTKKGT